MTSKSAETTAMAFRAVEVCASISTPWSRPSDTEAHKPSPEPILLALERLGAGPERAVYVGDAPVDVAAGKAAGVATVAVLWGAFSPAALAQAAPDFTVETPVAISNLCLDGDRCRAREAPHERRRPAGRRRRGRRSQRPTRRSRRRGRRPPRRRAAGGDRASHYHYYVLDSPRSATPTTTLLLRELEDLEGEYPELITPDSPTQRVGGAAGSRQLRHRSPCSRWQCPNEEELLAWDAARRLLGPRRTKPREYVPEPKIDGLAISLIYQDGV